MHGGRVRHRGRRSAAKQARTPRREGAIVDAPLRVQQVLVLKSEALHLHLIKAELLFLSQKGSFTFQLLLLLQAMQRQFMLTLGIQRRVLCRGVLLLRCLKLLIQKQRKVRRGHALDLGGELRWHVLKIQDCPRRIPTGDRYIRGSQSNSTWGLHWLVDVRGLFLEISIR